MGANNQTTAGAPPAVPAPVYVQQAAAGLQGVYPIYAQQVSPPADVAQIVSMPVPQYIPASNPSFATSQVVSTGTRQFVPVSNPPLGTPQVIHGHGSNYPAYLGQIPAPIGGTPIPIQQAPHNAVPVVVQQPVGKPPATIVYIQQPPATAVVPQLVTPQVIAGNNNNNNTPSAPAFLPFAGQQTEVQARTLEIARANGVGVAQDFKPSDDNPNRMYWCRELSNEYTLRDRRTIDQIGCRWYVMADGTFYAVKLP